MDLYRLALPMPPRLSAYYENAKRTIRAGPRAGASYTGRMISAEGLRFRGEVMTETRRGHRRPPNLTGPLDIVVLVCKDTKTKSGAKSVVRKGDLDNLFKCLLDALTEAKVIGDDVQFDDIRMIRGNPEPGGRLYLAIGRFNADAAFAAARAVGLPFVPDHGAAQAGMPF